MSGERNNRRVLVVHADRKAQRTVHRILGPAADEVDIVDDVGDANRAIARARPDLAVLDHHVFIAPGGAALAARLRRLGIPCLVLLSAPDAQDLPAVFDAGTVTHLLANPMPILAEELAITANKLWRGDYFGLEKYLAWGAEIHELPLDNSADRAEVVALLSSDVRGAGLSGRIASLASLITDELLSNALYNAPVGPGGDPAQIGRSRRRARTLVGRDRIRLRYACDARYLAIEVTDHHGSLTADAICEHVAKGARRDGANKVSFQGAGAGMGIALAYSCATQLVFNIEPGRRTEVIGLIDVRFKPAELGGLVSSFGVFEEPRDPDAPDEPELQDWELPEHVS